MLAAYAVADMSAADMPAGNVPSVLTADEAGSPTAPTLKSSSKKAAPKVSSSSTNAASTSPTQALRAPITANSTIQGLQDKWRGVQDAAQRDPGISDFLKAAARFAEAAVRAGLIVLRLLVQVTAVLLQFAVKLLVWLLDWAGQRTADRVAAVRQQNIVSLSGQAVLQQEGVTQDGTVGWKVVTAAAVEQAAPELHARAV
jgi:hypothetical protein